MGPRNKPSEKRHEFRKRVSPIVTLPKLGLVRLDRCLMADSIDRIDMARDGRKSWSQQFCVVCVA